MQLPTISTFIVMIALGTSFVSADTSNTYTDPDTFKSTMLDGHNSKRQNHKAPALTWDDNLAQYALQHSKGCVFEHSGGPYGENLAAGYDDSGAALQAWYDEKKSYDYSSTQWQSDAGHFTQMVWQSTTKVGCGAVQCDGLLGAGVKSWYLTCEYSESRGNVLGQFQQNVFPPSS
ncbi:hypothetical protein RUND412_002146 [Rhizina undulata]